MLFLLLIPALILVAWLLLPVIVKSFINRKLGSLVNYVGRVSRVNINLAAGRLTCGQVVIDKRGQVDIAGPFFSASSITFTGSFLKVLKKQIEGVVIIKEAKILAVKNQKDQKAVTPSGPKFNLKTELESMMPMQLNVFVTDSTFEFRDDTAKTPVRIVVSDVNIVAMRFHNRKADLVDETTSIVVKSKLYDGTFQLAMGVDLLAERPTFEMNVDVRDINLVRLNPFLRAHARLDVNCGKFSMFTEVTCAEGKFDGYIKPLITELDVIGPQDAGDSIFTRVWEGAVAFAFQLLKNRSRDQVATKIPIHGDLENPHVDIFSAVIAILRNAFIKSITPSFDDIIPRETIKRTLLKSRKLWRSVFTQKEGKASG